MRIFKSDDEYRGEGRRVVAEINNSGWDERVTACVR